MADKKYSYKALNKEKKVTRGVLQAANERALEQILKESNLTLITAKELKKTSSFLSFLYQITKKDLVTFFVHLEQLERAGVPLLESLNDLKEYSTNQKIKDITQAMFEDIKGGKLMSEAMLKHPKVFDTVMTSLVAMGEKTGNLEIAFRNIYENVKWSLDIRRKTLKAIRYPLFSLFVMLCVALVLLKVVVPKVTSFVLDLGINIPFYTIWLVNVSNFLQFNILKSLLIPVALYIMVRILCLNRYVKRKVDAFKLRMPLMGNILKKIEMARFTKFFGITFTSGIPVLQCLTIAKDVVKNSAIQYEIQKIRQQVSDGRSVSDAMDLSESFPNLIVKMFKVGEESGNVEEAMNNIQYFYEADINDSIEKIIGTIQPTLIFFMGGLMAWVIAAVFGPIYANFQNIGV